MLVSANRATSLLILISFTEFRQQDLAPLQPSTGREWGLENFPLSSETTVSGTTVSMNH